MPTSNEDQWALAGTQALQQTQAEQLRNSVSQALPTNPDQEAQTRRYAAAAQVPLDTARALPDVVKQQAQMSTFDASVLARQFPTTAQYLSDTDNARLVHDDIPGTANVEQAVKALPAAADTGMSFRALPDKTPSMRDRLSDYWRGLFNAPTVAHDRQQQGAAEATAILAGRQANPSLTPPANATPAQIQSLNNQAWETSRQAIGGMSQIPQIAAERFVDSASLGIISPTIPTASHSWQASTAAGLGQLGGFMVGPAKLAGGMLGAAPGANLLTHTAGESFVKALTKDILTSAGTLSIASILEQGGHAALDSTTLGQAGQTLAHAAGSGAEMGAVFGAAGRILPDSTVLQAVLRAAGVNIGLDALQGTNPLDDRPLEDKVFGYVLNTLFSLHGAGRAQGGWLKDVTAAKMAEGDMQNVQALGQISAASKLRERDPAAFKQFVQDMSEDGDMKEVYVDAHKLTDVLNQSGVTPDQVIGMMPELAKQMPDALDSNGMVRIPIADYATHFAGAPVEAALLPHLRSDPEAMTYGESQAFFQNHTEQLRADAQRLLTDPATARTEVNQADAQRVHDKVLDQLNAANRFRPEVNKTYAALTREFYATQAERAGMTPGEMFDKFPLKITGSLGSGANRLHQAARDSIQEALTKAQADKKYTASHDIMPVAPEAVAEASSHGLNIAGFRHIIDGSAIRHVLKGHGNEAKELARGNLPVTEADFGSIPDIIATPDSTIYGLKNAMGRDLIGYLKQMPDGSTLYLEEVRTGRKTLATQSMRRYPRTVGATSILKSLSLTSETLPGNPANFSVVDRAEGRNNSGVFDQPAYHGTPHDFDRFSTDKIGTGEGNQAYGHGLYFAESKDVAKEYQRNVTAGTAQAPVRSFKGEVLTPGTPEYHAATLMASPGQTLAAVRKEVAGWLKDARPDEVAHYQGVLDTLSRADKKGDFKESAPKGKLYQVDIPDEHVADFLRWDRSLGDQPKAMESIRELLLSDKVEQRALDDFGVDTREELAEQLLDSGNSGAEVYGSLTDVFRTDKAASTALDSVGVKGIKYLDGTSRDKGEGTHNLVVFDDKIVTLTHKDGSKVSAAERREYLQKEAPKDGPFGPITDQFKGDAAGAIAYLAQAQTGEAIGALTHPELGDIDLVWGKEGSDKGDGYGLAKLLKFHPEVFGDLQNIVSSMRVTSKNENRAQLESDDHKAAVRLKWDGDAKSWLLTAYVKDEVIAESRTDTSGNYEKGDSPLLTSEISIDQDLKNFHQEARGSFNPDTNTIALLKDADLSTFLHETGHFFLEVTHDIARQPDAPEGIRSDFDTLMKSYGVDGDTPAERMANWGRKSLDEKRDGHEKFARGFEAYLLEGKAPTLELQSLFSRFRSWLVNIYKSISNLNVQLTPEVRGVMDRLLASDDAIANAERTRGFAPLFDTPPEGVTPEQFADYQAMGKQATDLAISDMAARSLRDMQYASNAKSKALKDLQRNAATKRKEIREEATKEVDALPAFKAQEFMREISNPATEHDAAIAVWREQRDAQPVKERDAWKEQNPAPEKPRTPADEWKTQRATVEGDYRAEERAKATEGTAGLEKGQTLFKAKRTIDNTVERRLLEWEKDNPKPTKTGITVDKDFVAEQFGFADGKAMQAAITAAGSKADMVAGLTDQRMLERFGELIDPQSVQRAADAAVHNEVRAKFMATGLKMLTKSPIPASRLAKAAQEQAAATIAQQKVRELRPAQYSAAETRSNKEVIKLAPKDPQGAIQAQRAALLNNRLFKSATDAVAEVQKTIDYVKRFDRDSILAKIDIDIRKQIEDLLARFDFRKNPPAGPTRKEMNLEQWVASQREAGYAPAFTADMIDPTFRTHYQDMTVEQLRGLKDTIAALEHIGRERRTILVDGVRCDVNEVVRGELVPKMQERGDNFTDDQLLDRPENRYTNPVAIALDKFGSKLRAIRSQLKPQEFKRNEYDRHELLGPFGRMIFDRVFDANYRKIDMLKGLSDDFQATADSLGKEWQKSLNDLVPNTRLMDPDRSKEGQPPVPLRITRGRMIGLMIHMGNESNFDKVTKGWGFEPAELWSFIHENASEKDWQAAQSVWDQYEKHFPDMQAMARRLGNTAPDKIEARAITTKYGEFKGGYAAIKYDPLRSKRGEKDAAGQAFNPGDGLFDRNYFRADTTTNGSMNARVDGYTDRVDLDFHHIARTMHDSIHDLAYREALIDVNKLIEHSDFRQQFRKTYGPEAYLSMRDWIGRIANSENSDRATGALGSFLSYTRTGIVMNGIALRASTVLKHGGSAGIKTTGYFLGGGEKYLASRFASMSTDYRAQITGAKEKFPEIRARLLQQDRDYKAMSANLFEPESVQSKAERFGHAAVAWSDMMTAVPTAWAAYDRAITEGVPVNQGGTGKPMTEAQAVAYGSKIVREAHGSNIEASRSLVLNTNSEALKMFTTLYGFMNNSYGQAVDGFDKLRTAGISNPAILARSFMSLIVPAIWAGYLVHGAPGEEESWAAWVGKAILGEVAGMVPFVRDVASMVEGYRSAGVIGVESWLTTMVKAGKDVKDLVEGNHVHAPIKDLANAAGMGLHIPGLGQIGTTVQYLADVHSGDQNPESGGQMVKDALLGPKHH